MKYLVAILAVVLFLGSVGFALAAPTSTILRTILPEATNTYDLGSASKVWNNLYVKDITISGTCTGCGAGGGSGTISTSTALVSGQVVFSTGVNTVGNDSTFLFDSVLDKLTTTNASTTNLTVGTLTGVLKGTSGLVSVAVADTDYQVPLTFGDGLTRTVNDIDCDIASGSVFGCLSSANWTTFNNKLSNIVEDITPQLGGDLDARANDISDLGDITFKTGATGGTIRTGTSNADKFVLQAYDVNGSAYQKVLEADAGNTPTLEVFADSFGIWDTTDETKKFVFLLSGGTTGTTMTLASSPTANRTITFPDATGTLLYSGGPLGTPSSGTLTNATGLLPAGMNLTKGNFLVGNDAGIAQATSTMFISSTGNVGIGTTAPTGKLHIENGALRLSNAGSFTTAVNTQGIVLDTSASTAGIEFVTAVSGSGYGNRIVGVDSGAGSSLLKIQGRSNSGTFSDVATFMSTGNVGIGTTGPGQKLHIYGASGYVSETIETGSAVAGARLNLTTANRTYSVSNRDDYGTGKFVIVDETGATARLAIDSSGNVGIGETAPTAKLHIKTAVGGAATNSIEPALTLESSATAGVGVGPSLIFKGQTGNSTARYSFAGIQGIKSSATASDYSGALVFSTQNSGGATALAEAMRITSDGNVGIGTTTPLSKLQVSVTGADAYGLDLLSSTSHDTGIRIGRGTGANGAGIQMVTAATDYLSFYVNGSALPAINTAAQMVLTEGGNVGIGTTTPAKTFSVTGDALVSGFLNALDGLATKVASALTLTVEGAFGIDTTSNQFQYRSNSATRVLGDGNFYPSFTYATSTAWTATTTIPLGPAYTGETWNGVKCFTDTGTLNVSFYDGTNRMNMFNASTTVGTVGLTTNNTFTADEKRYVDIGTPASTPTKISCTVSKSLTAD